jgi:hypothetical protein
MTPAEVLTARLGGQWHRSYGTARCVAHDDKNPSLSIRDGDTGPLLVCHSGCSSDDIVDELKRRGWWGDCHAGVTIQMRKSKHSPEETRRYLQDVWRSCGPIHGSIAHLYLFLRGITIEPPPTLRAHSRMKHTETGLMLPCMVGAVQALDRSIVGLHRTYLREDGEGKAGVSNPRKFVGNVRGGAVRLAAAGPELAVGEGLETALSYQQLTGTPTWSALSSRGLMSVVLPPLPLAATVHILVDLDPAGEQAAEVAAQRFTAEGRRVRLVLPNVGKDINDVVRHG